jgi:hypothetical protein
MLRLYNTRLPNTFGMTAIYDEARRQIIREQALKLGLKYRLLSNVPDADEAFDGDIDIMVELLSRLITLGLTGFRMVATDPGELKSLASFAGPPHPFLIASVSPETLSEQESYALILSLSPAQQLASVQQAKKRFA